MPNYYEINEETARRAKEAYSFSEYKDGSTTASYRAAVDEVAALAEEQKRKTSPFYHDKIDALAERYAKRLAEWQNDYNRNVASCPSWAITGASNYNKTFGRKHARQQSREGELWKEYDEIERIKDKIKAVGTGPVDLADPNAREMITEQLDKAQKQLENAKAVNAHYKKNGTFKGLPGLSDEKAAQMDANIKAAAQQFPAFTKPFPDYELTSLRGKVKRLEERLAQLDKLQQTAEEEQEPERFDGFEVVRNAAENRLQIIFDDKPGDDVRDVLKSNGFKWSPKNQAWQRQLTRNAESALKYYVLPKIAPQA